MVKFTEICKNIIHYSANYLCCMCNDLKFMSIFVFYCPTGYPTGLSYPTLLPTLLHLHGDRLNADIFKLFRCSQRFSNAS